MKWSHSILILAICKTNAFILPHPQLKPATVLHSTPTKTSFTTTMASELRSELLALLSNPSGHKDSSIRSEFASKLDAYSQSEGCDPNDVLFAIGATVFGTEVAPPSKKAKTNGSDEDTLPILDFDYMKSFMTEVFLSYGVTPERAEICSDVLIESDKRGIDSHGLGRLKPIYCDRMDDGILFPDKPIDVLKESDCTALVGEWMACYPMS